MQHLDEKVEPIWAEVLRRNPEEPEFHQALHEVLETLAPLLNKHPEYAKHKVIEHLCKVDLDLCYGFAFHQASGTTSIIKHLPKEVSKNFLETMNSVFNSWQNWNKRAPRNH